MGIVFDLLKIGWQLFCMKFNLKKYPVWELHNEVMKGQLSESGLYRLLGAAEVTNFTNYHEKVKKLLELLDENPDDKAAHLEKIETLLAQSLELQAFFVANGLDLAQKVNRQRMWLKLNQIDNMIERDLEKSILRRRGKANVVRREG